MRLVKNHPSITKWRDGVVVVVVYYRRRQTIRPEESRAEELFDCILSVYVCGCFPGVGAENSGRAAQSEDEASISNSNVERACAGEV